MDIPQLRYVGSHLLIFLGALVLTACAAHTIYSAVKAKKSGIVRAVYPIVNRFFAAFATAAVCFGIFSAISAVQAGEYNAYVKDIDNRGLAAVQEYNNATFENLIDRESFVDLERIVYAERAKSETGWAVRRAITALIFAALAATSGAFITKDGALLMHWFSPEHVFAKSENGNIEFFDADEPEKTLFTLRATDNNLEFCKDFIKPEVSDNTKPAEQN